MIAERKNGVRTKAPLSRLRLFFEKNEIKQISNEEILIHPNSLSAFSAATADRLVLYTVLLCETRETKKFNTDSTPTADWIILALDINQRNVLLKAPRSRPKFELLPVNGGRPHDQGKRRLGHCIHIKWVLIFQFYNHSKYESDAESDAELDAESDAD